MGLVLPLFPFMPVTTSANGQTPISLQDEPWHTFALVQEQLFPKEDGSPGAQDINATAYLRFVLNAPDTDSDTREFILNGIDWLNSYSQEQTGQAFRHLSGQAQADILDNIHWSRAGRNWLSLLLSYLFEALLGPPAYGGNPGGVGWNWLGHQPGFPLPPDNKRYLDLA